MAEAAVDVDHLADAERQPPGRRGRDRAPDAVEELAAEGLIRGRGWANGPGMIWIPTPEGEAIHQALADGGRERPFFEPVKAPGASPMADDD
ncbi:MAG: hypothetical protein ACREJ5_02155 [Geminicoccaceae bacterium]